MVGGCGLYFLAMSKTWPLNILFLAALTGHCAAEDWTVNGKTYHNVTLTNVDTDAGRLSITFDLATAQHQTEVLKLTDLAPERAAGAVASFQMLTTRMALMIYFERGGPPSRYERYREERPAAVAELSKHPFTMSGTVVCQENGLYLIQVRQGQKGMEGSVVLDGKGGRCYLIQPSQSYAINQKIEIRVFPAGGVSLNGKNYPFYADDPAKAYDLPRF
jgi:hypothetical protein